MEKKNTILLTVIAIATLLVAVVGATFAYFTATVSVDEGTKDNNITDVTTQTMVSATMNFGNKVEGKNVLPGYKAVRSIDIVGAGEEGDIPVNAVITVKPTIADAFIVGGQSDVTWKLFKSDVEITCESGLQTTTGQYSDSAVCKAGESDISTLSPILEGTVENANQDATLPIKVEYNTIDHYYLVVEYANNGDQNAQQGQNFKVVLDFKAAD